MRFILIAILFLLAILAAGRFSRYLVAALAFGVSVMLFLVLFVVGAVMIVLAWSDESLGLMIGGGIVILLPLFGAWNLLRRARG